jgi:hypothetical protein
MTQIHDIEKTVMGNDNFAELMAGFSILSDAQEMLANGTDPQKIIGVINHAKEHIGNGVEGLHKELGLPGEFAKKLPMKMEDRLEIYRRSQIDQICED